MLTLHENPGWGLARIKAVKLQGDRILKAAALPVLQPVPACTFG